MKKLTTFVMALALSAITAAASTPVPDIGHDELKAAMKEKKVTLLDVNGSDTYKKGHIPGAIDFEASEAQIATKLPMSCGSRVGRAMNHQWRCSLPSPQRQT